MFFLTHLTFCDNEFSKGFKAELKCILKWRLIESVVLVHEKQWPCMNYILVFFSFFF